MPRHERPPGAAAAVGHRDALEPERERVACGRAAVPALGGRDRRPAPRGAAHADRLRDRPGRRPRRATSPGRPAISSTASACGSRPTATLSAIGMNCGVATCPRDLGVEERRPSPGSDAMPTWIQASSPFAPWPGPPTPTQPATWPASTLGVRVIVIVARTPCPRYDSPGVRRTSSRRLSRVEARTRPAPAALVPTRRRARRRSSAPTRTARRIRARTRLSSADGSDDLLSLVLAIRSAPGTPRPRGRQAPVDGRARPTIRARWRRPRTAARPSRSTPGARTSTTAHPSAPTSSSRRSRESRTSRSTTPGERRRRLRRATSATPASTRSPGGCIRRCTAAVCGRCASSRASARPRRRTSASATCSTTARRGSRPRSTCPRSWATTRTTRARSARSGARASRSTRSPTWRRSSQASRSATSRRR